MNTQFLKLAGGTIAYDDQGEGSLILCIPAGGDLRAEYRFLTPLLTKAGYRVVTMDMRGQGESSARWSDYSPSAVGSDAIALIRHLNAGPALIIGTSVATAAAIWASVEAPDLVNGVVLISGYSRAASPLISYALAYSMLAPGWGLPAYMAYFPKMYPSTRPSDFDTYLGQVKNMLKEPGRMSALRQIFANGYRDWDERVSQVKVPVLILMGSKDPDFKQPAQEAQRLADRMQAANVTVQVIDGAGHHLQVEMPDQAAQSVLKFLAKGQSQQVLASEMV